jgi:hypothetical protein
MKNNLCTLFFALLIIMGCNNSAPESTISPGSANAPVTTTADNDNTIMFKVNGEPVKTVVWNISDMVIMTGVYTLNVTSDMHKDKRTILLNLNAEKNTGFKPGTYSFVHGPNTVTRPGIAYGSYRPDYFKNITSGAWHFESGAFVISSIDTARNILNATFSGKVKNEKGEEAGITEGKIVNGKIKHPPANVIN